jgi:hypothetical protein
MPVCTHLHRKIQEQTVCPHHALSSTPTMHQPCGHACRHARKQRNSRGIDSLFRIPRSGRSEHNQRFRTLPMDLKTIHSRIRADSGPHEPMHENPNRSRTQIRAIPSTRSLSPVSSMGSLTTSNTMTAAVYKGVVNSQSMKDNSFRDSNRSNTLLVNPPNKHSCFGMIPSFESVLPVS